MVKEIKLKTCKEFFEKILKGDKGFELRLGDKNINKGNILILLEVNNKKELTGRKIKKKVNYVVKTKNLTYWDKEEVNEHGFIIAQFD